MSLLDRRAPTATARASGSAARPRPRAEPCTCRAGARPGSRRRPAAASSRPPRPAPPPARPHGGDTPPLGDQRHRGRLEHLEVALDAVAARRRARRRRSPAAAAGAGPAAGRPAPAPRSACCGCWSCAVCTPLMPRPRTGRPPCPPATSRSTPRPSTGVSPIEQVVHRPLRRGAHRGRAATWASAPRQTSATRWLTSTLPAPTAAGGRALTIVPARRDHRAPAAARRRWPAASGRAPARSANADRADRHRLDRVDVARPAAASVPVKSKRDLVARRR